MNNTYPEVQAAAARMRRQTLIFKIITGVGMLAFFAWLILGA